jgi:hypothetical protein
MPTIQIKSEDDLGKVNFSKGMILKIAKFTILCTENGLEIVGFAESSDSTKLLSAIEKTIGGGLKNAVNYNGIMPNKLMGITYVSELNNKDAFIVLLEALGLMVGRTLKSVVIGPDNNHPAFQTKTHLLAFLEYLLVYSSAPTNEEVKTENGKIIVNMGSYSIEIKQGIKYEFI